MVRRKVGLVMGMNGWHRRKWFNSDNWDLLKDGEIVANVLLQYDIWTVYIPPMGAIRGFFNNLDGAKARAEASLDDQSANTPQSQPSDTTEQSGKEKGGN